MTNRNTKPASRLRARHALQPERSRCWLASVLGVVLVSPVVGEPVQLGSRSIIRCASQEEGAKILGKVDEFARRLSPFDRSAMLKKEGDVSSDEILAFVSGKVKPWKDDERKTILRVAGAAAGKIDWVTIPWPQEIVLIKSSERVPYTRQHAIVFPQMIVGFPEATLERIMLHELFHILSRHNPDSRAELYRIIGFELCNEIPLPSKLRQRSLTNPDAPSVNVRIHVTQGERELWAAPVLIAKVDRYRRSDKQVYPAGYMQLRLLEIELGGDKWAPVLHDGEPNLIDPQQAGGFLEKIGNNTGYMIHPEEILADNFIIVATNQADVKSPEITSALRSILSK